MRIGCCGSTVNPRQDPVGIEIVESLKKIGYDYIELSLRDIMQLSGRDFERLKERLKDSGLSCEACNNLMPAGLKVTGPKADAAAVLDYLERAFGRAREMGTEIIVFGSPWSRDIEVDFSRERARKQMVDILRKIGPLAKKGGVTVAMEHVNSIEGNIFTSVAETCRLVRAAAHPNIQLLIDYYHMAVEKEPLDTLLENREQIRHVHFARLYKRSFPRDIREDSNYSLFFTKLKAMNYGHRISIEAFTDNFCEDAQHTLEFIQQNLT